MKPWPNIGLKKIFKKEVYLIRNSETASEDAYGQAELIPQETFPLKAEIIEITSEDLMYYPPGVLEIGDAWGYFLPSYYSKGRTVTIQIGDFIEWDNKQWRIERIEDFYLGKKLGHKRALLKRVV